MYRGIVIILSFWAYVVGAPTQEIAPITEAAKALFDIESLSLQNKQGKSYKIHIALPKDAKDEKSIFYLLDGNAFFPILLNEIANTHVERLPIIVGIGHDSPLAFDRALRTYDYTPLLVKDLQDEFGGGGGQSEFLDFILTTLKPLIKERFGSPKREMLFGHSFGGLFVLYALSYSGGSFSHYVCASPSLWWGFGSFVEAYKQQALKEDLSKAHIIFTRGDLEVQGQQNHLSKSLLQSKQNREYPKLEELVAFFNAKSPNVIFKEFANQTHGSSLPLAMMLGLEHFMNEE